MKQIKNLLENILFHIGKVGSLANSPTKHKHQAIEWFLMWVNVYLFYLEVMEVFRDFL